METNETNKALYEKAFIGNGEYTLCELNWKPDIDERVIEEWFCSKQPRCSKNLNKAEN